MSAFAFAIFGLQGNGRGKGLGRQLGLSEGEFVALPRSSPHLAVFLLASFRLRIGKTRRNPEARVRQLLGKVLRQGHFGRDRGDRYAGVWELPGLCSNANM